ncbi:hypothetical protein M5K25_026400 [Dendrobium thyrsiflorum]|uniref:DUF4005 domain-containing protein n=1 Tax=Dendrobium thyrsiflorum TaxID=117978 RepID=A0ABD0TXC1_DENTH
MGRVSRWFSGLLGRKKRWAFVKSFQNNWTSPPPPPLAAAVGDEQRKRAIAVAVATAAAAEAAMAAAKAAAAMVQLTTSCGLARLKAEERAAVKIQTAFRGYLVRSFVEVMGIAVWVVLSARRALRALKGLVKLQALVRGNIVRKQVAETLRCMNALVRVQAQACACRALHSKTSSSSKSSHFNPFQGPATPEKYEAAIRSISWKRNSLKQTRGTDVFDRERNQSANSNWLFWNMSKASKPIDNEKFDYEKLRFYSKRKNCLCHLQSSCCSVKSNHSARSLATEPKSLSKDSTATLLSTPSSSSVDQYQSMSPVPQHVNSRKGPFTPVKTERSRSFFKGYSYYPNYMANTESSMAKSRSQSAPRQRPDYEKTKALRRLSTQGLGDQATAAAGPRSSKFANVAYSGSGRLDILEMPVCM